MIESDPNERMIMTFDEFVRQALSIDENAYISCDPNTGTLTIETNWLDVGDQDVPLGYLDREFE
jgi:hypothetical protein